MLVLLVVGLNESRTETETCRFTRKIPCSAQFLRPHFL